MDFWDLTKLLVRRWYVATPMLVLSLLLAALTVGQVKPDYIATAYVQLVPPVLPATKPGQPTADQRNPWLSQGLQTLGNAAIVTVTDQAVLEDLKAGGFSESYTLTMGASSPLITFEIVGGSEQVAKDTAEQLVNRFTQNVITLQTAYGVSTNDAITARRLDGGTNVKQSDSKVKRALVAVVGVGLLLTVAVTVGVDALARWRRRRRAAAPAAPPPARPAPTATHMRQPLPTPTEAVGGRPDPEPTTVMVRHSNGSAADATRDLAGTTGVVVEYQSANHRAPSPAGDRGPEAEMAADATIVLPPSMPVRLQWPGHNGEKKKRP